MNCEKCQDLLSDFLDGALSTEDRRMLSAHLEECLSCVGAHDDLDSILSVCRDCRGEYDAPPNEKALWLRIRNIIESEQSASPAAGANSATGAQPLSWWARWVNRSWELSLPQLSAAVAAIVIAVSLGTAFSVGRMQNFSAPSVRSNELVSNSPKAGTPTVQLTVDDRVRHQQMEIDYWNKRIQQQMVSWSPQTRDSFKRNLTVIDQAVADSRNQLLVDPHDEVSEEMLNSALNEKMQLLREFSDL
ncbi:MAG: zf-HC2 domain-containing protein [Pyrinomonadaceae bacterium]|nr:zf-HC2 domain-containing protein [Pyrinomonadaceae bacterium]MBA3767146.1 zf-HC2 domain-containing protein [Acidobacteriota bacterium]